MNQIILGNCIEIIQTLPNNSVNLVVCSPPYAMQRNKLYGGIEEKEYPDWTVSWMKPFKEKMTLDGSIFIVIRPNIKNGEISDYVLRTRLKIREDGWKECEELIWLKNDAPPLGSCERPRRTWESILWFSLGTKPFCDLKICGQKSERVGGFVGSGRFGEGGDSPIAKNQNKELQSGVSRCSDVISVPIGSIDRGVQHPAMYPRGIPNFLIQTFSKTGDLVVDPFCGSGQTLIEAKRLERRFLGVEIKEEYAEIARNRVFG